MLGNIGLPEIMIVLIIALIVFGPKRLPELGRSLGKGVREFRASINGEHDDEPQGPREIASGDPGPIADEKAEPVAHKRP